MGRGTAIRTGGLDLHTYYLVVSLSVIFGIALVGLCSSISSGAGEVVDNFEWKVPSTTNWSGNNQYTETLLTDEVTGDIYIVYRNREPFSQYWATDSIVCGRVDPVSGDLVDNWIYSYSEENQYYYFYYFPKMRQYLVHDGHFYFLFYSNKDNMLHLRVDNLTTDKTTWQRGFSDDYNYFKIVGVHDDHFYFMRETSRDGATRFSLFNVSLFDFNWTESEILALPYYCGDTGFVFRNGSIHFLFLWRKGSTWSDYTFGLVLYRYNIGTGQRTGPTDVQLEPSANYRRFRFDIDSEGDLHILLAEDTSIPRVELTRYHLLKVDHNGTVEASSDIETLLDDIDVNYTDRWVDVIVNATDSVYVLGSYMPNHYENAVLCSFVFSSDYKQKTLRHVIIDDGEFGVTFDHRQIGMNSTGSIFLTWFSEIDQLSRVHFTHQIPLTPDLALSSNGFSIKEVGGATEPIMVSVRVQNVGRAESLSHWIEISYSLDGVEPFETIIDRDIDVRLGPNETDWSDHSIALPQGSHLLRLRIHDVSPYENNRFNNILLAWYFVSNRNPPTIEVELPTEGSTSGDSIMISGTTQDMDLGGKVTTFITGLPNVSVEILGKGPWNSTIDLDLVPSGIYVLSFRAFDGDYYSEVIYRTVRVARANDTMRLISYFPFGDVTLIEGEQETFFFNVSDPLKSVIEHRWRIDDGHWTDGSSFLILRAAEVGGLELSVEVSNGFVVIPHRWNVTVLPFIPPSIGSFEPADLDVRPRKRESLDFSIDVENPQGHPYIIIWSMDGVVIPGSEIHARWLSFSKGGNHFISASLFTTASLGSVSWKVTVKNEPPVVESWSPEYLTIVIEAAEETIFEVNAIDPDGDDLHYQWSVGGAVIPTEASPSTRILLPCNDDMHYSIRVAITDGELTTELVWTVQPEPMDDPTPLHDEGSSWTTVRVGVLIFIIVASVAIVSYYYVRRRGD